MVEGYSKRKTNRTNELLYLAWHIAALSRVQKIPELESLYIKDEKIHKQTDEDMMAMARVLNAAFGGVEVEV